jgi:tRNA(fMet)-specific endonuclease VapC
MGYLLDTNICVFFLRGKLNLDEIIKRKGRENCFISEITVLELRYGAENSDKWTNHNTNFHFDKALCERESAS